MDKVYAGAVLIGIFGTPIAALIAIAMFNRGNAAWSKWASASLTLLLVAGFGLHGMFGQIDKDKAADQAAKASAQSTELALRRHLG